MKKTRQWLERNKIFFEIFAFLVLGICGAYISFTQYRISKLQFDLSKKQIQPLLKISVDLIKPDSTNYYTQERLVVSNEGESIKNYHEEIKTLYKVEYSCGRCPKTDVFYLPVHGYYYISFPTGNFTGVLSTHAGHNNLNSFSELYHEFVNHSKMNSHYSIEKITLMNISYTDINDEDHIAYYNVDAVSGGYEIPKAKYMELIGKSDSLFKGSSFDAERVSFDAIWEATH